MGRGLIDARGKGFQVAPGEPKWWGTYENTVLGNRAVTSQAGTIDRVFLTPIWFPRNAVVSIVSMLVLGAGAGATNLRIGLYADNGGTPVGGALLETSANILADATGIKTFTLTTPREFNRGITAWLALITEDALVDFARNESTAIYVDIGAELLNSCRYQAAAFPAFDDPCPAATAEDTAKITGAVRIDNWAE